MGKDNSGGGCSAGGRRDRSTSRIVLDTTAPLQFPARQRPQHRRYRRLRGSIQRPRFNGDFESRHMGSGKAAQDSLGLHQRQSVCRRVYFYGQDGHRLQFVSCDSRRRGGEVAELSLQNQHRAGRRKGIAGDGRREPGFVFRYTEGYGGCTISQPKDQRHVDPSNQLSNFADGVRAGPAQRRAMARLIGTNGWGRPRRSQEVGPPARSARDGRQRSGPDFRGVHRTEATNVFQISAQAWSLQGAALIFANPP